MLAAAMKAYSFLNYQLSVNPKTLSLTNFVIHRSNVTQSEWVCLNHIDSIFSEIIHDDPSSIAITPTKEFYTLLPEALSNFYDRAHLPKVIQALAKQIIVGINWRAFNMTYLVPFPALLRLNLQETSEALDILRFVIETYPHPENIRSLAKLGVNFAVKNSEGNLFQAFYRPNHIRTALTRSEWILSAKLLLCYGAEVGMKDISRIYETHRAVFSDPLLFLLLLIIQDATKVSYPTFLKCLSRDDSLTQDEKSLLLNSPLYEASDHYTV